MHTYIRLYFENVLHALHVELKVFVEKINKYSVIRAVRGWVSLIMFLVILRRQYILLTLLQCTAEFFWKCYVIRWEQ